MYRIEIIGRIGQDAEVKDLSSNQVINFSVAVSDNYTNKNNEKVEQTVWFECAKWGNNTSIAQYLKKGTQVFISGKPSNRAWQNEQGEVKVVNGITISTIELLGSKSADKQQPNNTPQQNSAVPASNAPTIEDQADDLPF